MNPDQIFCGANIDNWSGKKDPECAISSTHAIIVLNYEVRDEVELYVYRNRPEIRNRSDTSCFSTIYLVKHVYNPLF